MKAALQGITKRFESDRADERVLAELERKAHQREYFQRPDVKAHQREYFQRLKRLRAEELRAQGVPDYENPYLSQQHSQPVKNYLCCGTRFTGKTSFRKHRQEMHAY